MVDPFSLRNDFVQLNVDSSPLFPLLQQEWKATVTMPDGQVIASAIIGQPETVTYWIRGNGASFFQINEDQAFVHTLWMHFRYDVPTPLPETDYWVMSALGLAHEYAVTLDAMREAVLSMPHVLADIVHAGYSEADVWAYTQAEAPWAVELVGASS